MRIEQLHYFREVVKESTISGAAEKIFVSQQAISQAVNLLEEELGEKLLIRTHKGIVLTDAGKMFHAKASQLLDDYDQLKTMFNENQAKRIQHGAELNIYASLALSEMVLENSLCYFYSQYPHLKIDIAEKSCLEIFPLLIQETDKIAFISILTEYFTEYMVEPYKEDLAWEIFSKDELLVAVSKKSVFAKKNSIALKEALKQPQALKNIYDSNFCLWVLANLEPDENQIHLNTNSDALRKKAVEENRAISFVTRSFVESDKNDMLSDKIVFLPFSKKLHITYLYLKSRHHSNTPIEDILIQYVRIYFKDK